MGCEAEIPCGRGVLAPKRRVVMPVKKKKVLHILLSAKLLKRYRWYLMLARYEVRTSYYEGTEGTEGRG